MSYKEPSIPLVSKYLLWFLFCTPLIFGSSADSMGMPIILLFLICWPLCFVVLVITSILTRLGEKENKRWIASPEYKKLVEDTAYFAALQELFVPYTPNMSYEDRVVASKEHDRKYQEVRKRFNRPVEAASSPEDPLHRC